MWATSGYQNCRHCAKCDQSNKYNRLKSRSCDKSATKRHLKPNRRVLSARHRTEAEACCINKKKIMRVFRWPLMHLCLPFCLILLMPNVFAAAVDNDHLRIHLVRSDPTNNDEGKETQPDVSPTIDQQVSNQMNDKQKAVGAAVMTDELSGRTHRDGESHISWTPSGRTRRSPGGRPAGARSLLMPINELRVSGSKLEPPSRPTQDWSKQRPYFGQQVERNVTVELGKTAHLTCKVFELGDKTVSWLRPRQNEILTAGRYTYIGDSRISSMNENGSPEWILEIKDVGLNDSTSYECQVSTDPKMSMIINLHVLAARARIKQSDNNYYPVGASIEFTCEILLPPSANQISHRAASQGASSQIYWYHNGNLINYARNAVAAPEISRSNTNFTIDWDPANQLSRLRLHNIQTSDSGNYTCKPTAAEPATVRLFVKKHRSNPNVNRAHYYVPNNKEAQRVRQQHYGFDAASGLEVSEGSGSNSSLPSASSHFILWISFQMVLATFLIASTLNHRPRSLLNAVFDAS